MIVISGLAESYSLYVAIRTVARGARDLNMPLWKFLKRQTDPTSIAVMMEDGGAVLGLIIAGVCTYLSKVTGQVFWDNVGSIMIGVLLAIIAVFLIV